MIDDEVSDISERLDRELAASRRWTRQILPLIIVFVLIVYLDWESSPLYERYLYMSAIVVTLLLILIDMKIGTPQLWITARLITVSPSVECLEMLIRLLPYVVTRRLVVEKLNTILRELDPEDVLQVSAGQWKVLYKYFWHGSAQQKKMMVRVAVLLDDAEALPYLRRMLRSGSIPVDLRNDIEGAIVSVSHRNDTEAKTDFEHDG